MAYLAIQPGQALTTHKKYNIFTFGNSCKIRQLKLAYPYQQSLGGKMSVLRRAVPMTRTSVITATLAGLVLSLGAFAAPAQAADQAISDASLTWGLNKETGAGAYNGSCNFLSAGTAGNTGSSRAWTESDGFFKVTDGNVSVVKDGPGTTTIASTWGNKCQTGAGTNVSPAGVSALSNNKVVLKKGTGTADPVAKTANIKWDGSFTSVFYGGLTYWTASNPELVVKGDGTATLTATASGYGASMEDTSAWVTIPGSKVTLAKFTGVTIGEDGFVKIPEYLGVAAPTSVEAPQVSTGATWGSFPADFVEFQGKTGTQSYWYSSGGGADVRKAATEVAVGWTSKASPVEPEATGDDKNVKLNVKVPDVAVEPEPEIFSWSVESSAASLATATQQAGGTFGATGALPGVKVTDTRTVSAGWAINGKTSQFQSATGTFDGSALGWTPTVTNPVGTVTQGGKVNPNSPGLATSQTLASTTTPNTSAKVDAVLNLVAPSTALAGEY
ncbi:MAG: hypothetical protein Q4P23_00370, partial [Micrococcaceae bacterium]|nr:hypothetical protein [Micrococcaceae bacterium]